MSQTSGLRGYCNGALRPSFSETTRRELPAYRRVWVEDVVLAAVAVTDIPRDEILGVCRRPRVAVVRAAVYMVAIEETTYTVSTIADLLGRDHSTLIKVVARIRARVETRPDLAALVAAIRTKARQLASSSGDNDNEIGREKARSDADSHARALKLARRAVVIAARRRLAEFAAKEHARLAGYADREQERKNATIAEARRLRRNGWSLRAISKRYGWSAENVAFVIGETVAGSEAACRA